MTNVGSELSNPEIIRLIENGKWCSAPLAARRSIPSLSNGSQA